MSAVNHLPGAVFGEQATQSSSNEVGAAEQVILNEGLEVHKRPYYYDGSLPRENPEGAKERLRSKQKSFLLKTFKKKSYKQHEEEKSDDIKSEGETSGVVTCSSGENSCSSSGSSSQETDEQKEPEKGGTEMDATDTGNHERLGIENGYETTRPINLKKGGHNDMSDLARWSSQESGIGPAANKRQTVIRGKIIIFLFIVM